MYSCSQRGPFHKLQVQPTSANPLTAPYLRALQQMSAEVKPVFRYECPSGYTHNATTAGLPDATNLAGIKQKVAPNKLWFVDRDGHVCQPNAGWGTQPALGFNDEMAKLYRNNQDLTQAKVQAAENALACDPCNKSRCGVSKRNIRNASSMLLSEMSDLDAKDREVGANGENLLGGGAKMSESTKCDLQEMVKDLTPAQRQRLDALIAEEKQKYDDKVKAASKSQLQCIVDKYNECAVEGLKIADTADSLLEEASDCSNASATDPDSDLMSACDSSSSCASTSRKASFVGQIQREMEMYKLAKATVGKLLHVYSKYSRKVKQCCPVEAEDERKVKVKIARILQSQNVKQCAILKNYTSLFTDEEIVEESERTFQQFKQCATKCATSAEGCGTDGTCVRSSRCTSNMCIPKSLKDKLDQAKKMLKLEPVVDQMDDWWADFYAKKRRVQMS